jgi:RHS repeat-associated protein
MSGLRAQIVPGTSYYLPDALGSAVVLADGTGNVQTSYTYEPYGATTSGGVGNANPARYTGREEDGTGLYYYRARYYDPRRQRFVSEDPLGFKGGSASLFAYVEDSPTLFSDPTGLGPEGPEGTRR